MHRSIFVSYQAKPVIWFIKLMELLFWVINPLSCSPIHCLELLKKQKILLQRQSLNNASRCWKDRTMLCGTVMNEITVNQVEKRLIFLTIITDTKINRKELNFQFMFLGLWKKVIIKKNRIHISVYLSRCYLYSVSIKYKFYRLCAANKHILNDFTDR